VVRVGDLDGGQVRRDLVAADRMRVALRGRDTDVRDPLEIRAGELALVGLVDELLEGHSEVLVGLPVV
jgi:hypothetical protein